MSGHTPGPWRVSTNSHLVFGAVRGSGLEPVGFIYGPALPEMTSVGLRALADAKLAAAAPELLEALETAAEHIASVGFPVGADGKYLKGGEWTFDDAVPRSVDAVEVKAAFLTIRAAIAGATGESA